MRNRIIAFLAFAIAAFCSQAAFAGSSMTPYVVSAQVVNSCTINTGEGFVFGPVTLAKNSSKSLTMNWDLECDSTIPSIELCRSPKNDHRWETHAYDISNGSMPNYSPSIKNRIYLTYEIDGAPWTTKCIVLPVGAATKTFQITAILTALDVIDGLRNLNLSLSAQVLY